METNHRIIIEDAAAMDAVQNQSIDLVVTSPPYPMIQMWDELFCTADPGIEKAISESDTETAFERMHQVLDDVWNEVRRVIKPGGLVCINIGDATRSFDGQFRLFANHARTITALTRMGFTQLPAILWRKPTNSPNKFMGSGMLPPNAYVTLEHEYILIFRWGAKRTFSKEELKRQRAESAYFWEERNGWFSDVWFDLRGVEQDMPAKNGRERSGAFPFELPYRLINMYSVMGDMVLDPFLGTGTTTLAAMCSGRNSIGFEVEEAFKTVILQRLASVPSIAQQTIKRRIESHLEFVAERMQVRKQMKHTNPYYDFPVMTRQEAELRFATIHDIRFIGSDHFRITYTPSDRSQETRRAPADDIEKPEDLKFVPKRRQLKLF